ncbi:MAG: FAD-dependent oxidoreductase [Christensenellaceae bacterium]|jgi:thioredoxin reductase (NADPH)|nr:FAD-dependent oxidoreductase [Christensenellaceae bacterium]
MTKETGILIIGAGPAGLTAGIYAARCGGQKVTIIEKLISGGQVNLTKTIDNYPSYPTISGFELATKMHEHAEHVGCEFVFDEIESIDLATKTVKLIDDEYKAKAIIIATGAGPRKSGAIGEDKFFGAGVHYCAICDGAFYKDKDVVMLGGGNTAVEDAMFLAGLCNSVTIVNLTPNFNANITLVEEMKKFENIKNIYHRHKILEIAGDEKPEKVICENLDTNEIFEIPCDGLFIAIGRIPDTSLLGPDIKTTEFGYIITDRKCKTSLDGVYAAGDVIDKDYRQVITACADGAIAATAAAEYIRSNH